MQPGMIMDGGPDISGTWINRKTNKKVVVRDCVFDGDLMIIRTKDGGQIYGEDFTNNYFQVSAKNEDVREIEENIGKPDPMFEGMEKTAAPTELSASAAARAGRAAEITGSADGYVAIPPLVANSVINTVSNKTDDILNKIFKDADITLQVTLTSSRFPRDAVKVAMEYLDVPREEIIKYLIRKVTISEERISEDFDKLMTRVEK